MLPDWKFIVDTARVEQFSTKRSSAASDPLLLMEAATLISGWGGSERSAAQEQFVNEVRMYCAHAHNVPERALETAGRLETAQQILGLLLEAKCSKKRRAGGAGDARARIQEDLAARGVALGGDE